MDVMAEIAPVKRAPPLGKIKPVVPREKNRRRNSPASKEPAHGGPAKTIDDYA
jgi:hypothetical protein